MLKLLFKEFGSDDIQVVHAIRRPTFSDLDLEVTLMHSDWPVDKQSITNTIHSVYI
jgi:hypothetical protein